MSISEYDKRNLLDEFDSHASEIKDHARIIYDLISNFDVLDQTDDINDDINDVLSRMRYEIEQLKTGPNRVWAVVDAKVHVEWDREDQRPTGVVNVHMEGGSPEDILDDDGDSIEMDESQCSAWRNVDFDGWSAELHVS